MPLEVIHGTTTKPAAADSLERTIKQSGLGEGELIIGFPNLANQPGDAVADALWISKKFGPVLFDLVEENTLGNFERRQDDIYRLFQSRLLVNPDLTRRRKLIVDPLPVTFAPRISSDKLPDDSDIALVVNPDTFRDKLLELDLQPLNDDVYGKLLSTAQGISSIRKSRQTRVIYEQNSRGAKLQRLEDSISTLDNQQHHAVIETVEGVQRIRGLAGSGKTVILALKAAYLHSRHPDWKIAVTFYTRALKETFRNLITTFCVEQSNIEPDWGRIRIINAWGGRGNRENTGIYKDFCDANSVDFHDLRSAKSKFGNEDPFGSAVDEALNSVTDPASLYDIILVDEAQDFPPSFLRLCYNSLDNPKRLVYAYDELQSLSGNGLPDPEIIFGSDINGTPLVSLSEQGYNSDVHQDIVLEKCYRNSRPVLSTAHALGFGVYRDAPRGSNTGLVQMFDQDHLWNDIGYESQSDIRPGEFVKLFRTTNSSPKFLEDHSDIDDLIQFHSFDTVADQNEWVARQIVTNITEDELRHDDLMVINPNPFSSRKNLGPLRTRLLKEGIDNHLAGVDSSTDVFFDQDRDSVTFTGINRAKGNEAAMVYIVNSEEGNGETVNLATIRNRIFTAITRSKAWVRVCGVGYEMDKIVEEFERIKQEDFALCFNYPTDQEKQHLRIVHREVTGRGMARKKEGDRSLISLISALREGSLLPEDIDPELRHELGRILGNTHE